MGKACGKGVRARVKGVMWCARVAVWNLDGMNWDREDS